MKHNNLNQLFSTWGQSQRQLPSNHGELKSKILAVLPTGAPKVSALPRRIPWLSAAFTGLAILSLFLNTAVAPQNIATVSTAPAREGDLVMPSSAPAIEEVGRNASMAMDGEAALQSASYKGMAPEYYPHPYPYQDPSVPITDSREFLRTDYNATIRTRDVQDLTRRVETTVRGFDGRVDSSNSSEKWGSVTFAVPAAKFDAFRTEIESFAGDKFIMTNVHTENMLPQKQSIEEQKKQAEKDLATFKADRQRTVSAHNSAVASIQTQLNSIAYALTLQQSPESRQALLIEQSRLHAQLASENASYWKKLSYADSNIKQAESSLEYVNKQDKNLLDTVATVRGTISVQWISIWEVIKLYVSVPWMFAILIAAAIASYFFPLRRHRSEAAV